MTEQQQHPITPPPELMEQWRDRWIDDAAEDNTQDLGIRPSFMVYIATQAARWGADTELNECCHLLRQQGFDVIKDLRAARRPRPPSLAEQALAALNEIEDRYAGPSTQEILVRRALERLQELEKGNESSDRS